MGIYISLLSHYYLFETVLFYISILPLPIAITYVFYEGKVKTIISNHAKVIWWVVTTVVLVVMGYAIAGQYNAKLPGWGIPVYTLVPCVLMYITYYLGGWKINSRISWEKFLMNFILYMDL